MNVWGRRFFYDFFVETCANNFTYVVFPSCENRKLLASQRFDLATASCDTTSPRTLQRGEFVIKVFDGDEIKCGVLVIFINPVLLRKRRLWVPAVGKAT
jgi:hypothetical protein